MLFVSQYALSLYVYNNARTEYSQNVSTDSIGISNNNIMGRLAYVLYLSIRGEQIFIKYCSCSRY